MYDWATLYAHQRGAELRQEKEKQRIIQQVLEAHGERERFYAPALAWIGRQFLTWGETLQTRYADIEAPGVATQ